MIITIFSISRFFPPLKKKKSKKNHLDAVPKRLFCFQPLQTLGVSTCFLQEMKETEKGNSQLFGILKFFENGSIAKKLQEIMYLTLIMENDRLF